LLFDAGRGPFSSHSEASKLEMLTALEKETVGESDSLHAVKEKNVLTQLIACPHSCCDDNLSETQEILVNLNLDIFVNISCELFNPGLGEKDIEFCKMQMNKNDGYSWLLHFF
jgi:hypothetical protein